MSPSLTKLCAQLVRLIVRAEGAHPYADDTAAPLPSGERPQRSFHQLIVSMCHKEFRSSLEQASVAPTENTSSTGSSSSSSATTTPTSDDSQGASSSIQDDNERELAQLRQRRRVMGVIRFVGELFLAEQLIYVIPLACVDKLFDFLSDSQGSVQEVYLDECVLMLRMVGDALMSIATNKSGKDTIKPEAKEDIRSRMAKYHKALKTLADSQALTNKARFMVLDYLEGRHKASKPE